MFTIKVRTFRTLDGNEDYEVINEIGRMIGPAYSSDFIGDVQQFLDYSVEYLAERGIEKVKVVYELYLASATPDVDSYIWDIAPDGVRNMESVR